MSGYPKPQKDTYAIFDKFKLRRDVCEVYTSMSELPGVMDAIRARNDIEGAVIYLERADDVPVGLVKIKSDHYVIARRTRETVRGALVNAVAKNKSSVDEGLSLAEKRLINGMRELTHVGGCKEHHKEWADHAIAFARAWASEYKKSAAKQRQALVEEFNGKYGFLYQRFWETKNILPLATKVP